MFDPLRDGRVCPATAISDDQVKGSVTGRNNRWTCESSGFAADQPVCWSIASQRGEPPVRRTRASGGPRRWEPVADKVEEEKSGRNLHPIEQVKESDPVTELIVGAHPGFGPDCEAEFGLHFLEGREDLVSTTADFPALCLAGAPEFAEVALGLDDQPARLALNVDPSDRIPARQAPRSRPDRKELLPLGSREKLEPLDLAVEEPGRVAVDGRRVGLEAGVQPLDDGAAGNGRSDGPVQLGSVVAEIPQKVPLRAVAEPDRAHVRSPPVCFAGLDGFEPRRDWQSRTSDSISRSASASSRSA